MLTKFTPEEPCRCGYDGDGVHQCHAGRDPQYPGARYSKPGVEALITYPACLAGMQMKLGVAQGCYCADDWEEAGYPETAKKIRAQGG